MPNESILGLEDGELNDWTEDVETRFQIWGNLPSMVDFNGYKTWGQIENDCFIESLVSGDCLVVLRPSAQGLPKIQLISGNAVQTPILGQFNINKSHTIVEGVELDANGNHVAYWILQDDMETYKRLPAYGTRSGRRVAWLVYATEKRLDEVRGQPILAIILQSLKEVDRYRDSAQRKARTIGSGFLGMSHICAT